MSISKDKLKNIVEAAILAVAKPMSVDQLLKLFTDDERPSSSDIKEVIQQLQQDSQGRGVELKKVASGFRYQARQDYSEWLSRLWEEKPAKYSRAALETLALIAYRQPTTRSEIEDVRGVGVSSSIIKTLIEREWIRVVGHRDVPGRPALYATTKQFLDYFDMTSLQELPTLAEIKDLDDLNPELDLPNPDDEVSRVNSKIVEQDASEDIVEDSLEQATEEESIDDKNDEGFYSDPELETDNAEQVDVTHETLTEEQLTTNK